MECSGNGKCNCGMCECFETDNGKYTGHYCEKLVPKLTKCSDFEECVLCHVHEMGPLVEFDFCANCTDKMVIETQETVDGKACFLYRTIRV